METAIKGKTLMLFIGGKTVALAKSCNLSLTANTVDEKTKDSGNWPAPSVESFDWSVNCQSLVCLAVGANNNQHSFDTLFAAWRAGSPVTVVVGIPAGASGQVPATGWTAPTASGSTPSYTGNAIITSLSMDAATGDNATCTIDLQGVGALTKQDSSTSSGNAVGA